MKPAVVAIVAFAAWRIGRRVLRNAWLLGLAVLAFVALAVFGVSFPLIVIAAALAGFVGARAAPRSFLAVDAAHAGGDAVIDEHSQTPGHAQLSWARLAWVLVVGVVLWLAAMALLVAFEGGHGTLSHMAQFFSKAALVTFGGAYAVLPYVNEAAVEQYGWLTAPQMVDGLALGETTPGPLIMVVTFVGYVGAWTHAAVGLPPWLAGLAGATVATYFTFLPSFVFIFAGGPLVEATRGRRLFTAPLAAVTAAVVGVIANLALYFARHVFWPAGLAHPPDWITLAIACGAALALFWFRLGVIPVILACGVAGLIVHL
jgi:chromate transporter